MKRTTIAALALTVAASATIAADRFNGYEAHLRGPVASALGAQATFRGEHLGAGYLCGEASADGTKFERFISYDNGYALEGASLLSFYPPAQQSWYVSSSLRLQADMGDKFGRHVSRDELYAAEFNTLWGSHCK